MKSLPWDIDSLVSSEVFSKVELSIILECTIPTIEIMIQDWYKAEWDQRCPLSTMQKERVLYLGTLCYNLEGSYNTDGIKRWFRRRRMALQNQKVMDILCCIDYIPHLGLSKHRWPSEDLLEEIKELSMVHAECT